MLQANSIMSSYFASGYFLEQFLHRLRMGGSSKARAGWAVPGFKDTLLRCLMEPEVFDGATQEVF